MNATDLSQRQKNIILILAKSRMEYITVKNIANMLNLSSRTVQRDLVAIENFLYDNDFTLIKKPGYGLMLSESKESVDFLEELLAMIDSSKQYEKTDRIDFILSRLLTSTQPIKYFAFTVYLDISEKTLADDLKFIEKWLSLYDIKLIKKRGEGVSIKGSERSIRKAQAKLINKVLNDDKKIEILRNINDQTKIDLIKQNDVLTMIDREIIEKTRSALNRAFKSLQISISDNSYVSLLVHISLAIERLKQNYTLDFSDEIVVELKDSREYEFSKKIIKELEKEFDTNIPDIEIYFITMHMKGTNIVNHKKDTNDKSNITEAFNVTNALIRKMEKIYGLNLSSDFRLEDDLKAHLIPALTRLKFNFPIKNPILPDIKEKYKDIFDSLKSIAPDIIRTFVDIPTKRSIPDDEIGYIAIHFINAIESKIVESISINTITICPTGYGTSRLLASNLSNHFNNINIVANASIMEITQEFLKENDVDLIVSTIHIDNIFNDNNIENVEYQQMPAIPDEDDYLNLTTKLRTISRKKFYSRDDGKEMLVQSNNEHNNSFNIAKNLFEVSKLYDKIFGDIVFFKVIDKEHIISISSKSVSHTEKEYEIIKKAIDTRNKIESTYYREFNLHLLHAKCDINSPRLAFGKVEDNNDNIIVMISGINEKIEVINLFSAISSKIVDDSNFDKSISSFNKEKIKEMVINIIYELISEKMEIWRKNNET